MRGIRWQLLAVIVAVSVFAVVFLTREPDNTPEQPEPSPTSLALISTEPPTATPTPEVQLIAQNIATPVPVESDNVVTFTEGMVGQVQRLNPLFANLNPVDESITSLIFEGLTRVNQYGEAEPALAREWVVSFDGLEYVFILRDDVLWHDGVPFTAADVIYTISILSSADFPGAPELSAFWRTVETEQISETLVRFRLTQPLSSFPEALRIGMLPVHVLQGTNAAQIASHPFNLSPIGTGPYQLEALRTQGTAIEAVDLRVAPVFRQRPEGETGYAVDRMRFRLFDDFNAVTEALRSGVVDGYASRDNSERPALLTIPEVVPHTGHEPEVGMLIFNWANEDFRVFRDQRVRQALINGLDRDSIIQRHLVNLAVRADNPLPRQSWAYDGSVQWPPYNPQAARDTLAIANIAALISTPEPAPESTAEVTAEPTPASSALFSFTILTLDDPALVSIAQEIAAQWDLLNVEVAVETVDAAIYRERIISGAFDAALVEIAKEGSADPDMYAFWHEGQYPEGQNFGGVNDRVISETLERARRDLNGVTRAALYREFQQAFINRAIAIPLYYPLFTYAVSSEVTGVQFGLISQLSDRFLTLKDWQITR
ncbi:MAG: peptide ABC transporter substrate-binding protein [Anaerolineae bacterium]